MDIINETLFDNEEEDEEVYQANADDVDYKPKAKKKRKSRVFKNEEIPKYLLRTYGKEFYPKYVHGDRKKFVETHIVNDEVIKQEGLNEMQIVRKMDSMRKIFLHRLRQYKEGNTSVANWPYFNDFMNIVDYVDIPNLTQSPTSTNQQQVPTTSFQQQVQSPATNQQIPSTSFQQQVPSTSFQQQVQSPATNQQQVPTTSKQQVPLSSEKQKFKTVFLSFPKRVANLNSCRVDDLIFKLHGNGPSTTSTPISSITSHPSLIFDDSVDIRSKFNSFFMPSSSDEEKTTTATEGENESANVVEKEEAKEHVQKNENDKEMHVTKIAEEKRNDKAIIKEEPKSYEFVKIETAKPEKNDMTELLKRISKYEQERARASAKLLEVEKTICELKEMLLNIDTRYAADISDFLKKIESS